MTVTMLMETYIAVQSLKWKCEDEVCIWFMNPVIDGVTIDDEIKQVLLRAERIFHEVFVCSSGPLAFRGTHYQQLSVV